MELTDLDRRIVGSLMTQPRAPWRVIADVLGVPERTVARRGAHLLEEGVVEVVGILARPSPLLVMIRTAPGTTRVTARALAARDDTSFVFELTGAADCLAELLSTRGSMPEALSEELPAIVGVRHISSSPILHYFKTLRDWQPKLITDEEAGALGVQDRQPHQQFGHYPPLDPRDREIVEALYRDGRASAESIARRAGVSEATVRRRIATLTSQSILQIRTFVEPALLGLPVEAVLFIKAPPARIESVGRELAALPMTRYVAAVAGEYQVVANVTLASLRDLYDFTITAPWAVDVGDVTTSLVLRAAKRGGRVLTVN